jgi:hypothetical protein
MSRCPIDAHSVSTLKKIAGALNYELRIEFLPKKMSDVDVNG